jgi:hypothetical protein
MSPEQQLQRTLWNTFLRDSHNQRIENMTGSGVPDITSCQDGLEVWIETKVEDPYVLLRPFQWAWMRSRWEKGGRVLVLAATKDLQFANIHIPPEMRVEARNSGHLRVVSPPYQTIPLHRNNVMDFWILVRQLSDLHAAQIAV